MEYRIEHDSMGEVKVPSDRLWGAQTQRSHENFRIGEGIETMPSEIIRAFGILKKAAALANHTLVPERMTDEKLDAVCAACDEVIGGRLADFCILTSDNPRSEDPMAILEAIEEGIKTTGKPYKVIENRTEAIRYALNMAEDGDVIVLAGKGHETYQEIKGVKYPFDEKQVVADLLREMEG